MSFNDENNLNVNNNDLNTDIFLKIKLNTNNNKKEIKINKESLINILDIIDFSDSANIKEPESNIKLSNKIKNKKELNILTKEGYLILKNNYFKL